MIIKGFIQMLSARFFASGFDESLQPDQNSTDVFLTEAREAAVVAGEEFQYGETASGLLTENGEQSFFAIAHWHYERSAKKYRLAAAKISEVIRLSVKDEQKSALKTELQRMLNCAERADKLMKILTKERQSSVIAANKQRIYSGSFDAGMINSSEKILYA